MAVTAERLFAQVRELHVLPTLPGALELVCSMVEDDFISPERVGEFIARDVVLSAKVLRMINTPFYGFPGRIASIPHAVVLLGTNVVKGLVLTGTSHPGPRGVVPLWRHCLGTALFSRQIAQTLSLGDPEEHFAAGLLHDLGKVVLAHLAPAEYEAAGDLARSKAWHIARAEHHLLGVDHAELGAWTAEQWNLPEHLKHAIACHHAPRRAQGHFEFVAVVHVADILARAHRCGDPGDGAMPAADEAAFEALDLTGVQREALVAMVKAELTDGTNQRERTACPA